MSLRQSREESIFQAHTFCCNRCGPCGRRGYSRSMPIVKKPELVLENPDTGRAYIRFVAEEGTEFAVTFRHSVNKSDVTEIYEVRDGAVWLTGCVYYHFGAGVAEELDPNWELTMGENGEMILSNINMELPNLIYRVGTVYDHILTIGDERIVLNELCGRNARVRFTVR